MRLVKRNSNTHFNSFRPDKEVEMMKALIPHLRLLTLPLDKLDPLSKYLSNSQIGYLAKRLIFKDEDSAGKFSPPLNLSTSLRSRPKTQKFKFDLIAEDLIKSDWQMMGLGTKKNTKWNNMQITFIAAEHLVLEGVEILTRANNSPKTEFVSKNSGESSR